MVANAIDLTTTNAVKLQLRQSDSNADPIIQAMITAFSAFIIKFLSRDFKSASYVEVRDGMGGSYGTTMAVMNTPITAVSSVIIGSTTVPASTGFTIPGYTFDDNFIYLRGFKFCQGVQNVQLSYTAGFATIPYDIEQACIELVCNKYRELDRTGQNSKTLSNQTMTFSVADIPPTVKAVLEVWKEVAIFS